MVVFSLSRDLLAVGTCEVIGAKYELSALRLAQFGGLIGAFAQNQIYAAADKFRIVPIEGADPIPGSELGERMASLAKRPNNQSKR
jgi:hypothetical protein